MTERALRGRLIAAVSEHAQEASSTGTTFICRYKGSYIHILQITQIIVYLTLQKGLKKKKSIKKEK